MVLLMRQDLAVIADAIYYVTLNARVSSMLNGTIVQLKLIPILPKIKSERGRNILFPCNLKARVWFELALVLLIKSKRICRAPGLATSCRQFDSNMIF